MLTGYKAWKMINESFNGSYSLGVKTPRSLGMVGSKLSEMGFGPHEEDDLDPETLAMLGGDEDNQDPDLGDDLEGDDLEGDAFPPDDLGGDLEGDELGDELGGDELGDELGGLDMGDELGGEMGGEDLGMGGDDLASLLGQSPSLGAGDEMGGEEDDLSGMGDLSAQYADLFGDDSLGGPPEAMGGDQGPGAPDFGGDEMDDEEFGDDETEDEDEEDDEDEPEESESDKEGDKADAFAKKKSKKFMGKHCDDETMYSKKFMSVGNKGADLSDLTTKWMKKEDASFFNSLIGMGKGDVHQKWSSNGQPVKKQVRPGQPGFAPQGRVGQLPTVSQFSEWKKNRDKKSKKKS